MKFLKLSLGLVVAVTIFILSTTQVTSCTKTKTDVVHDTTIVTHTDTLTVTDTLYNDIKNGLVAYYNFTSGTLKDSSGLGNDIVFNSATSTADRFGNPDGAYLFDGTSSYMRVANANTLSSDVYSFMVVFKANGYYPGTHCHANQLFGKGYPDNIDGLYVVRFTDPTADCSVPADFNKEVFELGTQGAIMDADTAFVKTGQWYNVIYTYDGVTAKVFVNGQLKKSLPFAATYIPNTNDLYIGKHEDPAYPYYFNGAIDEIRIYNRALTQREVDYLSR